MPKWGTPPPTVQCYHCKVTNTPPWLIFIMITEYYKRREFTEVLTAIALKFDALNIARHQQPLK